MNIQIKQGNITEVAADLIVVNLFQGVTAPGGATGAVDRALGGSNQRRDRDRRFHGQKRRDAGVVHTRRAAGATRTRDRPGRKRQV